MRTALPLDIGLLLAVISFAPAFAETDRCSYPVRLERTEEVTCDPMSFFGMDQAIAGLIRAEHLCKLPKNYTRAYIHCWITKFCSVDSSVYKEAMKSFDMAYESYWLPVSKVLVEKERRESKNPALFDEQTRRLCTGRHSGAREDGAFAACMTSYLAETDND